MSTSLATVHEHDAKDSAIVPRVVMTQSNTPQHHISKPKRYSTQRQRLPADKETTGDVSFELPNAQLLAAAEQAYYGG